MSLLSDTSSPRSRIDALLRSLYGQRIGEQTVRDVSALIARHSAALKALPGGELSERDALLISYADQVREDGVAPLQTLASFCEQRIAGVISGVHILPFYPWSSDDGFSVKDFFAVEPAYGTWEDLEALRKQFDLMFDAVFNHMSAQGDWFQRFLHDEPDFRDFFVTVDGNPDLSQVIRLAPCRC